MADINSKFDIGVTTGPIRGSRKVQIGAKSGSGVRVERVRRRRRAEHLQCVEARRLRSGSLRLLQ